MWREADSRAARHGHAQRGDKALTPLRVAVFHQSSALCSHRRSLRNRLPRTFLASLARSPVIDADSGAVFSSPKQRDSVPRIAPSPPLPAYFLCTATADRQVFIGCSPFLARKSPSPLFFFAPSLPTCVDPRASRSSRTVHFPRRSYRIDLPLSIALRLKVASSPRLSPSPT